MATPYDIRTREDIEKLSPQEFKNVTDYLGGLYASGNTIDPNEQAQIRNRAEGLGLAQNLIDDLTLRAFQSTAGGPLLGSSGQAYTVQDANELIFGGRSLEDLPVNTPIATRNLVPDWAAYARMNRDVATEWNKIKGTPEGLAYPTLESFAQFHYNRYGKTENRPLPQIDASLLANKVQLEGLTGLTAAQLANKAEAESRLAAAQAALRESPFSIAGLQKSLGVGLRGTADLPPNWDNFSQAQKVQWMNQNKVTLPQLGAFGITNQADIQGLMDAGYKPPGTAKLAAAPITPVSFLAPTSPTLPAAPTLNPTTKYISELTAPSSEEIAPGVVTKNMGGPIAFKEGSKEPVMAGEKKYALKDFNLPEYLGEDFKFLPGVRESFNLATPRNVVFNPELRGLEALVASRMTPEDYRDLLIRQGRTGREYMPYLGGISVGKAATGNIRPLNYYYAEGGEVGRGLGSIAAKGYAEELAREGRFGDTMLAHISPEEARMLEAMGGAGTINPQTGLPEYFSWKKLFKKAGPLLGIAASLFGGPLAGALVGGISGGFSGPGGKFNWKRGLLTGIASYGLGQLGKGLTGAADAGAAATSTVPGEVAKGVTTDIAGSVAKAIPAQAAPTVASDAAKSIMFQNAGTQAGTQAAAQTAIPAAGDIVSRGMSAIADKGTTLFEGAKNLVTNAPGAAEGFKAAASMTPYQATMTAALPTMAVSGMDEATKQQMEVDRIKSQKEEEEERNRLMAQQLMGGIGFGMARGGLSMLARGGASGPPNTPRTINGAGDGMSDSVPATIEGIQEARLADGEFVIPADVVADLGNGSSNAGAKQLYAMMNRIRKSRHGTTKQPPEVDMGRLMPA